MRIENDKFTKVLSETRMFEAKINIIMRIKIERSWVVRFLLSRFAQKVE
jgi:hypothetical protein